MSAVHRCTPAPGLRCVHDEAEMARQAAEAEERYSVRPAGYAVLSVIGALLVVAFLAAMRWAGGG